MKKRILSLLLAVSMVIGMLCFPAQAERTGSDFRFADDGETESWDWASDYIYKAYDRGLFAGDDYGRFNADKDLSRTEAVIVLLALKGVKVDTTVTESGFADGDNDWYSGYLAAAKAEGISAGYLEDGKTNFHPTDPVTRTEFVIMLLGAMGIKVDTTVTESGFADGNNDWYSGYLAAAKAEKLTAGYNEDGAVNFHPMASIKRCEAATMVCGIEIAKPDTEPEESTPAETTPVETTPAETTPAETTPAETTPAETTPVETTPTESTPTETTPAETTPVETTPAETTPVETPPEETAPVVVSGTCGDSSEWTLTDGVLTISGSGAVVTENTEIGAYETQIRTIVIGAEITSVDAPELAGSEAVVYGYEGSCAIEWAETNGMQYAVLPTVDEVSVSVQNGDAEAALQIQTVNGQRWLFLPAYADLTAVTFSAPENPGTITVNGAPVANGPVDLSSVEVRDSYRAVSLSDGKNTVTVNVMQSANISAMFITSDDPVNKGRSYVDAVKGREVTGSMLMVSADGTTVYNNTLGSIKSRGNSTWWYPKKPYQIKLGKKTDLLGTGEKAKTWILLAGYVDSSLMHDKLYKDLALEFGLSNTANTDWVDLYYDGEYRGTYELSEKIQVNSTSVDITDMEAAYEEVNEGYGDNAVQGTGTNKYGNEYTYVKGLTEPENYTGGWLIEENAAEIDEMCGFEVSWTSSEGTRKFNVKSPEYAGQKAMEYISEYMEDFQNAVYARDENGNYTGYNTETGKYYYDYCDKESLVKVYLVMEFCCNTDGYYKSTYFYKDVDGIMYCGPIWDGDLSFGTGWNDTRTSDHEEYQWNYLVGALMRIPDFAQAVSEYYNNSFSDIAENSVSMISDYYQRISDSEAMNHVLWPAYYKIGNMYSTNTLAWPSGTTYQDIVNNLQQWVTERSAYLDKKFAVTD